MGNELTKMLMKTEFHNQLEKLDDPDQLLKTQPKSLIGHTF